MFCFQFFTMMQWQKWISFSHSQWSSKFPSNLCSYNILDMMLEWMRLQPLLRHFVHLKIQIKHFRSSGKLRYSVRCSQSTTHHCENTLSVCLGSFNHAIYEIKHRVMQCGCTFEFVDEILKCDQSYESYWAVLYCGAVYYAVQGGSSVWVCGQILKCDIQVKATEQYFTVVLFIMLYTGDGSNASVCEWNP